MGRCGRDLPSIGEIGAVFEEIYDAMDQQQCMDRHKANGESLTTIHYINLVSNNDIQKGYWHTLRLAYWQLLIPTTRSFKFLIHMDNAACSLHTLMVPD